MQTQAFALNIHAFAQDITEPMLSSCKWLPGETKAMTSYRVPYSSKWPCGSSPHQWFATTA